MRYFFILLVIAVTVYAVTDCSNAKDEDLRGLPRGLWMMLVILLPGFGAIAWFAMSSSTRRARATGSAHTPGPRMSGSAGSSRPARTGGPIAPDDDPEFLWRLEQERRRAARNERNASTAPGPDAGPDSTPKPGTPGESPTPPTDGDAASDEAPDN